MKIIQLLYLIITTKALVVIAKRITLPFKKYYPKYNIKSNSKGPNSIEKLINSNIGIEINIGTPTQSFILNLALSEYLMWIIGTQANTTSPSFSLNQSSSMQNETNFISVIKGSKMLNAKDISDTIILNQHTIPNMKIQYATSIQEGAIAIENSGVIGLDIQPVNLGNSINTNIVKQLKAKREISSYAFMIKYITHDSGKLIIGEYPHEYTPKRAKLRNYMKVYHPVMVDSRLKWGLTFRTINYNNTKFESKSIALFQIEFGFILGSDVFHKLILLHLFTELLNRDDCKTIRYNDTYQGYECNATETVKEYINNNFKDLEFDIDKSTKFSFQFKDLFIEEDNGKLLFMVVFMIKEDNGDGNDNNNNNEWILGEPFFKKYAIVFDQDKKLICYYGDNLTYINESIFMSSTTWAISIVCIVMGVFIICYCIKSKRLISKRKQYDNAVNSYQSLEDKK